MALSITVIIGVFIGLIPCISMMLTSLVALKFSSISSLMEINSQNLCAGLITGAVAQELFPELGDLSVPSNLIGVTLGFLFGGFFFQGMDWIIEMIEFLQQMLTQQLFSLSNQSTSHPAREEKLPILESNNNGRLPTYQSLLSTKEGLNFSPISKEEEVQLNSDEEENMDDSSSDNSEERTILRLATQAMSSPGQRSHLFDEISQILRTLEDLQAKAVELSSKSGKTPRSSTSSPSLSLSRTLQRSTTADLELLAEKIDEEAHRLQYFIDHCRRLIHGSGANFESVVPRIWITAENMLHLQIQLTKMKAITNSIHQLLLSTTPSSVSLISVIPEAVSDVDCKLGSNERQRYTQIQRLSKHQLKNLYQYLDDLEKELNSLHGTVEGYTYQWGKRSKRSSVPIPEIGSTIPMSFMLPVTIDCIVDGFLLGITASINVHAGCILSLANSIEMGFLGLAVSIRIQKCTGSSLVARLCCLIFPPLIMFGTALISTYFGYVMKNHVIVYKFFISFGIIALLSLVINELLVEARETARSMESLLPWWSGMIFFFGIYLVLLMDVIFPKSSS